MDAEKLIRALVPACIAEDLIGEQDEEFAAMQIARYLLADRTTQADILSFHMAGGPAMTREAKRREECEDG